MYFSLAGNFIFSAVWIFLHNITAKLLHLIDSSFASDFIVSTDLTDELAFYNPNWVSASLVIFVPVLLGG